MTPVLSPHPALVLTLSACTNDPFDAAIRLLGDAQRYGFDLEKLEILRPSEGSATLRLDIRVPPDCDIGNIRDRFSRHDALSGVTVCAG